MFNMVIKGEYFYSIFYINLEISNVTHINLHTFARPPEQDNELKLWPASLKNPEIPNKSNTNP